MCDVGFIISHQEDPYDRLGLWETIYSVYTVEEQLERTVILVTP